MRKRIYVCGYILVCHHIAFSITIVLSTFTTTTTTTTRSENAQADRTIEMKKKKKEERNEMKWIMDVHFSFRLCVHLLCSLLFYLIFMAYWPSRSHPKARSSLFVISFAYIIYGFSCFHFESGCCCCCFFLPIFLEFLFFDVCFYLFCFCHIHSMRTTQQQQQHTKSIWEHQPFLWLIYFDTHTQYLLEISTLYAFKMK